jgi:hypothetical protein
MPCYSGKAEKEVTYHSLIFWHSLGMIWSFEEK